MFGHFGFSYIGLISMLMLIPPNLIWTNKQPQGYSAENENKFLVRKYSTVFYRGTSDEDLDLSGFPKSSRDNIQVAFEKQVLIISLGAKLKGGKCKTIRDWFLANEFADFGDPLTNFFMSRRLPKGFVEDKDVQQKVVEYFASFDEHIKDFRIEKVPHDGETKEDTYKITALHKMIDSDGMAEIPLGMESAGTLKMFALYPELQEVLEKGRVFFIDELNARLHPLLVRNFLLTFLNPEININHAQIVFTTYDTWQLSNQLLRRDEIWFVEKDERGVSMLYSLADFVDGVYENKTGQKYSKADEQMYGKLCKAGDEEKAIQIAQQKLEQCIREGKTKPSEMCPCTMVHELVGEIKSKANLQWRCSFMEFKHYHIKTDGKQW